MTAPVESPCRQVCRLGGDQICDGCGRTIQEIAAWYRLGPADRLMINRRVEGWVLRGGEIQTSGQDQPRNW